MNENTEFDWEWAKRGGVCITPEGTIIIYSQRGALEVNKYPNSVDGDCDFFWGMPRKGVTIEEQACMSELGMATRAECEAAGVEYIDRPVSTEDIEHMRGIEYARGFDDGFRKNQQEIEELNEELHLGK